MAIRLRWTTVAVLPPTPTRPVWSTSNAAIAVLVKARNSCDWPSRVTSCSPAYSVDRARDGVVQASVQRAKIFHANGGVHFHRQVRDRLTDVAITVDNL
jgi:hypothetical protein